MTSHEAKEILRAHLQLGVASGQIPDTMDLDAFINGPIGKSVFGACVEIVNNTARDLLEGLDIEQDYDIEDFLIDNV